MTSNASGKERGSGFIRLSIHKPSGWHAKANIHVVTLYSIRGIGPFVYRSLQVLSGPCNPISVSWGTSPGQSRNGSSVTFERSKNNRLEVFEAVEIPVDQAFTVDVQRNKSDLKCNRRLAGVGMCYVSPMRYYAVFKTHLRVARYFSGLKKEIIPRLCPTAQLLQRRLTLERSVVIIDIQRFLG